MRNLRHWLAALIALVFVTTMGAASAQNVKKFDLGAPSSATMTTTTIQVTFKNLENGNSSFNSIGIKGIPAGGVSLAINGGTASPGGPGTPSSSGGYFFLTGLSPVKKGDTLTVTLNVTLSGSTCASGSIAWHGRAFTGSPASPSTEFQQNNADPVTTIAASCTYSISGSVPSSMAKGTSQSVAITVNNAATSTTTITSVSLTPPAGITATGSPYAVSIAPGASSVINVPATAICGTGAGGSWTSSISGFTRTGGEPGTSVTGACTLAIETPTSVAWNDAHTASASFDSLVTLKDGNNVAVSGVAFTLSGSAGCSFATNPTGSTGSALTSLVANLVTGTQLCTLGATTNAAYLGATLTASKTVNVYDGVLDCDTSGNDALTLPAPVNDPGEFHGAIPSGQTGFIAGVRGVGDSKGNTDCTLLNYTLTNQIPGGSSTDPNGNTVPAGFYSFSFDASVPNPVVAILSTYLPEWGDGTTGLPTRKTMVCTQVPCTTAPPADINDPLYTGPWKIAPACLATAITHSSIPAGSPGACLASEGWVLLSATSCTGTPPAGPYQRCLQVTSIAIVGVDPVFGR